MYYKETGIPWTGKYKNLVVTRTFSKAMGLASCRIGFACAHEDMIQALHSVRPMYETNAFGGRFAELVLDHPEIFNRNAEITLAGKEYIEKKLDEKGIKYFKSHTNFLLIDVGSKEKSADIVKKMKAKKVLIGGSFNHPGLDTCIRITAGPKDVMARFFSYLEEML
ncbi:MAG: aminotransferase class I/II-fold pyridoxal phosphate-dependent enzyme, partial [Candidatus Margulisiibacteriota bacterium]